jgi:hypothetical protein
MTDNTNADAQNSTAQPVFGWRCAQHKSHRTFPEQWLASRAARNHNRRNGKCEHKAHVVDLTPKEDA